MHKNIHDLNTYHFFEGEITISGNDENGDDFTLTMNAYEVISWLDTDDIRDELAKWILKNKNKNKYKNKSQEVIMNNTFIKD
ncbi:MAG: hypothetical protein Unbinned6004contig1002_28 [Prokaryotic dsDNA virus sp.]|nr:MAG: hypothetical protein Unbinned6004contig1002_28 [Prokaryotic dsDNA virus sp.]|tara:strand:+ start:3337 stop:3582 length:246 start_codon:yes stop_codon:yes gene_type:complete